MLARSGSRRRGGRILKSNEGSFAASIRLLRKKRRQGCDVRLLGGESFPLSSEEGGARAFRSRLLLGKPSRAPLSGLLLAFGPVFCLLCERKLISRAPAHYEFPVLKVEKLTSKFDQDRDRTGTRGMPGGAAGAAGRTLEVLAYSRVNTQRNSGVVDTFDSK